MSWGDVPQGVSLGYICFALSGLGRAHRAETHFPKFIIDFVELTFQISKFIISPGRFPGLYMFRPFRAGGAHRAEMHFPKFIIDFAELTFQNS